MPVAAILAGGRSSRLGPGSKALADLGGRAMVRHVIDRLAPQAKRILLSVQADDPELAALGCQLVPDLAPRFRGPLMGLCSAMERLDGAGEDWLLLAPCDAPFLPLDLATRLAEAAAAHDRPVAAARYLDVVQPVFSLWHRSVLRRVRAGVLERGRGGLMSLLDESPHVLVDWPEHVPEPFLNVNTPADLERARAALDGGGE